MANTRIKKTDALWLAVAIMLHTVVILIPLHRIPPSAEKAKVVEVILLAAPGKMPVFADPERPAPPLTQSQAAQTPPPQQAPIPSEKPSPGEPEAAENDSYNPVATISAARLIDLASRFNWPSTEKSDNRQLGVFMPQAMPSNWRPSILLEDNLFNGMVLPVKTEIVDRWLTADGIHNVVVNTPSGETLCGRARPWNPMIPALEPVMNFWKCGGGGKRTFKMPDRYLIR